jgi:TonB family protein
MNKFTVFLALCLSLSGISPTLGQTQPAICPKHIESPTYPMLARQVRLTGEVTLSVTVDADGKVQHVTALPGDAKRQAHKLLRDSAIENVQHWRFSKPPTPQYTEVIVYEYEDDPSLPLSGGRCVGYRDNRTLLCNQLISRPERAYAALRSYWPGSSLLAAET